MRRRELIALLGGVAAACSIPAGAQQPSSPVIGFLSSASAEPYKPFVSAYRSGLNESGFVEGQNIAIEFRWAEGQYDRLSLLAAELVRRPVRLLPQAVVCHPYLHQKPQRQPFQSSSPWAAIRSSSVWLPASIGRGATAWSGSDQKRFEGTIATEPWFDTRTWTISLRDERDWHEWNTVSLARTS